ALCHAVGPERDQVTETEDALAVVVFAVCDHAEQGAAGTDLLGLAAGGPYDQGRRVPRAGHGEEVAALDRPQRRERRRTELLGRGLRANRVVHDREDAPWGRLVQTHDA